MLFFGTCAIRYSMELLLGFPLVAGVMERLEIILDKDQGVRLACLAGGLTTLSIR
jgi:hypothetical protein